MADTIRPEARDFFDDAVTDRVPPVILALAGGEIEPVVGLASGSNAQQSVDAQQARLDAVSQRALDTLMPRDPGLHLGYYSEGGFHAL